MNHDEYISNELNKWMGHRRDTDYHLQQMKDALDRKKDQIEMLGRTNDSNLQMAMDRKAHRIKEMIEMRGQAEQERVSGRQAADNLKDRFDMQKVKDSIATVGSVFRNVTDPVGYVSTKIDKNKEVTKKREEKKYPWGTEYFNNFENMKVSEEAFEGLKNIAKLYNVRWQPSSDGKLIEGTLSDYELEDHDVFAFVANGQILLEAEIPVSRWDVLNNLFKNRLYIDGNFNHLDFLENILYKVLPKKNHIKKFVTTEEHFLKVYNKMIESEA